MPQRLVQRGFDTRRVAAIIQRLGDKSRDCFAACPSEVNLPMQKRSEAMRQHLARSLLCATIACVALVSSCHHTHPELESDPVVPDRDLPYVNVNWMRLIPDDRYLSEITIPGTHDSGADKHTSQQGTASWFTICQNFRIANQLNLGVRWFDIRLSCDELALTVFHGPYYLHKNFGEDVLDVVVSFLKEHPTETVVLMIKQENSSVKDWQF
ncbi:hypothetical protein FJY70_02800, partial [candidate division WOR-3 bacterium]|nr:hypothetical protein [candidate division WOR-3 bacterium]